MPKRPPLTTAPTENIALELARRLRRRPARIQKRVLDLVIAASRADARVERQVLCRQAGNMVEEAPLVALLERFAANCSDSVVVLRSAFESARRSPYVNIKKVDEALTALGLVAQDWVSGKTKKNIRELFADLGVTTYKSKISKTARGKYRRHYEFVYEGMSRIAEEHLTLGAHGANTCLSIHFFRLRSPRKVVVAHVGRHLPNTRT